MSAYKSIQRTQGDHSCFPSFNPHAIVFESIEEQLGYEPLRETRNRKLLRPNPIAPWELRIGNLRVFYEVVIQESDVVRVLAVGRKEGNLLIIAGKEVKLS